MPGMPSVIRPPYWCRILYYMGLFLMTYGVLNLLPIAVAAYYGDTVLIPWFAASSAALIAAGYFLSHRFEQGELDYREAAIAAAAIFIIPGFVLAPAFMLYGYSFIDGLFDSVSGITTTGLSVFSVEELPPALHFARALYQWMGGLGIAVFALTFLIRPGTAARRLYSIHLGEEKPRPSASSAARLIAMIYALFTLAAFAAYLILGDTLLGAIVHAFTTVSTGGFSIYPAMPYPISAASLVLMTLAAQPLMYLYLAAKRNPTRLLGDPQLRSMLLFSLLAALYIYLFGGLGLYDSVYAAFSAITTTGYTTADLGSLPDSAKYVLSMLMIMGAAVGSTGGGLKQYRVILVLKEVKRVLHKTMLPEGVVLRVKYRGSAVGDQEIRWAFFLSTLYLIVLASSTLLFLAYGYGLADSLFETSSALATTGLSVGLTGHGLPWPLKLVLIIDMWMGRVEIVPVLILLNPANIGRPSER